jgi:hypothetical protein
MGEPIECEPNWSARNAQARHERKLGETFSGLVLASKE